LQPFYCRSTVLQVVTACTVGVVGQFPSRSRVLLQGPPFIFACSGHTYNLHSRCGDVVCVLVQISCDSVMLSHGVAGVANT
jgi:hypothetical protein